MQSLKTALSHRRSLKVSLESLKSLTKPETLLATEPVLIVRVREKAELLSLASPLHLGHPPPSPPSLKICTGNPLVIYQIFIQCCWGPSHCTSLTMTSVADSQV